MAHFCTLHEPWSGFSAFILHLFLLFCPCPIHTLDCQVLSLTYLFRIKPELPWDLSVLTWCCPLLWPHTLAIPTSFVSFKQNHCVHASRCQILVKKTNKQKNSRKQLPPYTPTFPLSIAIVTWQSWQICLLTVNWLLENWCLPVHLVQNCILYV